MSERFIVAGKAHKVAQLMSSVTTFTPTFCAHADVEKLAQVEHKVKAAKGLQSIEVSL